VLGGHTVSLDHPDMEGLMQRYGSGVADLKTRSVDVRGAARRRKAASDKLLRQTEELVDASKACLARSRETLDRLAHLERAMHAHRRR